MRTLNRIIGIGLLGFAGTAAAADNPGPDRDILATLDTNGDGAISFIEFQARDNRMLALMDSDQNGVLTIDEFLNDRPRPLRGDRPERANRPDGNRPQPNPEQIAQMQERMTASATERFHAMDTDGDEIVTLEEFQLATFAEMDRNEDGVLSGGELRPQRMGRPGPGGRGPRGQRGDQEPQN